MYTQKKFKKDKLVFTTSIDNNPGFMLGCKVLINSIKKYHPTADIIIFLENEDVEFEEFCESNNAKVINFNDKLSWLVDVANSRPDLLQDTTHYHHPDFKPVEGLNCPFDVQNNQPGFDRIRHRHPLNFKAYCTGWCILHENYEYVCHIDSDAFLVSNIQDIYDKYPEDNCVVAFQDNTDNLPNLEKLYNCTKTSDFHKNTYAFNAGVVFYHNGDKLKTMIEDFMFYIECPYHYDFSGTLCDQGVLRALVAKYHMSGQINYHIEDKTNWNPIHGYADKLELVESSWINKKNGQKQYIVHTSTCKIWYNEWPTSDIHKPWKELGGTYISKFNFNTLPYGCLSIDEIQFLYKIISDTFPDKEQPIKILEIGTYFGKSAIGLGLLLRENAFKFHIDTVDIFLPSIDFPNKNESYETTQKSVNNFNLTKEVSLIKIHQGQNLTKVLKKDTYDAIFIDGEHQFGYVYADCYYADKLAKKTNSLIMGDDYGGQVADAVHTYFSNKKISYTGKIWTLNR